jgi:hypothetical protein
MRHAVAGVRVMVMVMVMVVGDTSGRQSVACHLEIGIKEERKKPRQLPPTTDFSRRKSGTSLLAEMHLFSNYLHLLNRGSRE